MTIETQRFEGFESIFQPSFARKALFRGRVLRRPRPPSALGLQIVSQAMSGVDLNTPVCFQKKFM